MSPSDLASLVEAFEAQAVRVGATVQRSPRGAAAATALQHLQAAGCATISLAAALPDRPAFQQAAASLGLHEVQPADLWPTRRADGGISWASLGVAETGSVLLHSSPEDRRVELCVDLHLVLLGLERLVPTLDGAFAALRDIAARPPAYASLVSGPSRSADIERTLTIGIHGPRVLHLLLLDDQP